VIGLDVPKFVMKYRALLAAGAGMDDALALAAKQREARTRQT
jgi:hypothetical protein